MGTLRLLFPESVCPDDIRIIVKGAGEYWFSQYEFENRGAEYIISDVEAGDLKLKIDLPNRLKLDTNIYLLANTINTIGIQFTDTTNYGSSIKGTVMCSDGTKLRGIVKAYAEEEGVKKLTKKTPTSTINNGTYEISKLVPEARYKLDFRVRGFYYTNIILSGITPEDSPCDLVLPNGFNIYGSIVDSEGTLVPSRVRLKNTSEVKSDGNFTLFPVPSGYHTLLVKPRKYASFEYPFTLYNKDLDLGNIVIPDTGVTIRGRILDANGNPVSDAHIHVNSNDSMHTRRYANSDHNGYFTLQYVPRGYKTSFSAYTHEPPAHYRTRLDELWDDVTDLGDITLAQKVLVIIARNTDKSAASLCYANGTQLDEYGMGILPIYKLMTRITFTRIPPFPGMATNQYYVMTPQISSPITNTLKITLPAWLTD